MRRALVVGHRGACTRCSTSGSRRATRIHGVLVDVFEVGVLLLGKSGIGKSECALELVMRGHRLVADDVIECDYRPPGMVFGSRRRCCATTSRCAGSAS